MNILWITYAVLGKASELLYNTPIQGGGWIDCNMYALKNIDSKIDLTILSLGNKNRRLVDDNGVVYIEIAGIKKRRGLKNSDDSVKWGRIISKLKPDLIQVYGIEYSNGYDVLQVAHKLKIPILYYIQGLMCSFVPYKYGGLTLRELIKTGTIDGIIKLPKYYLDYKLFNKQAIIEKKIIKECDGVIIDGEWTKRYLKCLNRNVKINYAYLPVSKCFLSNKWNHKENHNYSIFTIAGRSPYKGLHNVIKAVGLLKNTYPDICLKIPGNMEYASAIRRPSYISYISKLIKEYKLEKNVVFLGQLTPEQMAEKMLESDLFVMPSCIENHSSTLREAMYIGMPCVTSNVGCIPEMIINGQNALTYRYEEYIQLAGCIDELLSNPQKRYLLGQNAYKSIRNKYPQEAIGAQLTKIYNEYTE